MSRQAVATVALYVAPAPGQEDPLRVWDDRPDVLLRLPVPLRDECPRCRHLMSEGGALAGILVTDDYCLAPYVHSLGVLPE